MNYNPEDILINVLTRRLEAISNENLLWLHGLTVLLKVCMWKFTSNNDFKINAKTWSRPIVLLGGGTTLIGDPSGKD